MTENVVNNGQANSPSDGVSQGLYEESATQKGPLGARRALNDGRVFRYAEFTAVAVPAGNLVAPDVTSQFVGETDNTSSVNSAGTNSEQSSGATRLYFQDTSLITAANSDDVLAGGYLHMLHSETGGYTYRIKSNAYAAATSVLTVDLYDPTVEVVDSEAEFAITGNLYQNITIANMDTDDAVCGITVRNVTASYYAWVQTWGPATVLADESNAATPVEKGSIAVLSDGVNGAAAVMGQGQDHSEFAAASDMGPMVTEPIIGFFLSDGATDTHHTPIYLQLNP